MERLLERFLDNPTPVNLGALLGFNDGEEDIVADSKALALLIKLRIIPSREDVQKCRYVHENGIPCGRSMRNEGDRQRKLGFRFVCDGRENPHRKISVCPLQGTLLEKERLPPSKVLRLLISYIHQQPVTAAAKDAKVTAKHAVNWYKKFRNVA